ncbi:MAG: hypothetical protein ABMB14_35995 [Myxococcota bacterium]
MRILRRNPMYEANRSTAQLQSITSRLVRAQDEAITGIRVRAPSDAPGRWSQIHALQSRSQDEEVWQTGADSAQTLLDTADGTLSSAEGALQRALERAVQLSSESYSTEDRAQAADEIGLIRDELLGYANTKVGDRFLFAGDAYDGAAFDVTGVYQGSVATASIRIGPDEAVDSTFDGSDVFQGSVDTFQVLADLEAALTADDPDAVAATIGGLESAHAQVVASRSRIGFRQLQVDDARVVSMSLSAVINGQLSAEVGADPASAYTELAALQVSYQATLQVTAANAGSHLFDLLR